MGILVSSGPRRRRTATALVAIVALMLTACAGEGPEQASDEDDTIKISVTAAPRSLDPAQLDAGTQSYVWASIFDTLLYIDNDGQLQPNAAESWEYSEDGLTLTLKLREGMTFSTGESVTAEAVKANLERNKVTPGQQQDKMQAIESIETPDDRTVVVNFQQHDPAFLHNMAMDAGVVAHPDTLNDERTATDPIGSGAYILNTSETVNGSTYVLDLRDDHWNADAYPFETVIVKVMPDQTAAFNALQSGQVDAAFVQPTQVETLGATDQFEITYTPSRSIGFINLADRDGTTLKPLADVRVRQAINLAFDRENIAEKLLQGAGEPTVQQFNLNGDAYDPTLETAYSYDPERAKALLAEAGYPDGFDVTMPATVISTNFEPTISQSLGDIGIDVTWEPVPAQNSTAAIVSGEYPMYFFISGSDMAPREMLRQLEGRTQNPFDWGSPELNDLLAAANGELDPEKRAELYKAVNKYVVEEALFAPLFYIGSNMATTNDIKYLANGSNNFATIRTFDVAE